MVEMVEIYALGADGMETAAAGFPERRAEERRAEERRREDQKMMAAAGRAGHHRKIRFHVEWSIRLQVGFAWLRERLPRLAGDDLPGQR
jgi:hypothetical protein